MRIAKQHKIITNIDGAGNKPIDGKLSIIGFNVLKGIVEVSCTFEDSFDKLAYKVLNHIIDHYLPTATEETPLILAKPLHSKNNFGRSHYGDKYFSHYNYPPDELAEDLSMLKNVTLSSGGSLVPSERQQILFSLE